jgi:hypothetical protein
VAWSPAGHVAYVEQVIGGDVRIEEYNHGYPTNPGTYDTRTVPAGNFQYIHFADVGPGGGPPHVEYVWGQGTDNGIYEDIWNGSSWGGFHLLAPNLGGNPVVVGTGYGQQVWARGTNGAYYEDIWSGSSWSGFNALAPNTFTGDPVIGSG